MWGSDYVQLSRTPPSLEQKGSAVSWDELQSMDLPSFEPAFLVLCRVLLNVIHECLKLRLEQRPAGEPSLLSIKQVCFKYLVIIILFCRFIRFILRSFFPVIANNGKWVLLFLNCSFLGDFKCSLYVAPRVKTLVQPFYHLLSYSKRI